MHAVKALVLEAEGSPRAAAARALVVDPDEAAEAAHRIQRQFRRARPSLAERRRNASATLIQSMVRGGLARRAVEDRILDDFWQQLMGAGFDVMRRPRKGPPLACKMWANPQHLRIYINSVRLKYPTTDVTGLFIMDIAEVREGVNTRTFEQHFRYKSLMGESNMDHDVDPSRCFSLVGVETTLDLEGPTQEASLDIVTGLRILARRTAPRAANAIMMRDRHPELVRRASSLDVGDVSYVARFVDLLSGRGLQVFKIYTHGRQRGSEAMRVLFIDPDDPRGPRLCLARRALEGPRPYKGIYLNDVSTLRKGSAVVFTEESHTETPAERQQRLFEARRSMTVVGSERSLCMRFPDTATRDRVLHGMRCYLKMNGVVVRQLR